MFEEHEGRKEESIKEIEIEENEKTTEIRSTDEIIKELSELARLIPENITTQENEDKGETTKQTEKKRKTVTFDTPLQPEKPRANSTPYVQNTIMKESDNENETEKGYYAQKISRNHES